MRIGVLIGQEHPMEAIAADLAGLAGEGVATAWMAQVFDYDAMTLIGSVGPHVPGLELGTAVVPVHSRLPQAMAQQALTVQAATGGRFVLGIGLSHQLVVEGMWGIAWDHPARFLAEYLSVLVPLLHGEAVDVEGERVTARIRTPLQIPGAAPPPVLVAALGPVMLRLAGRMAQGTVTWMTGLQTIRSHTVPTITRAAEESGRPRPRVAVGLPVAVTSDVGATRERIDRIFAIYRTIPSYRAMLDREGAAGPSDVSIVGDEDEVAAAVRQLGEAGATDLVASLVGNEEGRARTARLLASMGDRP